MVGSMILRSWYAFFRGNVFLYRFLIYNDCFTHYTSKRGSLYRFHIMLLDVPKDQISPGHCISRLWLTAPGISSPALMDEVCVDINTEETDVFLMDVEEKKVRLFHYVVFHIGHWLT